MIDQREIDSRRERLDEAVARVIDRVTPVRQTKSPVIVALDGRSGSGKSTLARAVVDAVGGVVVITDDFYSGGDDEHWASRSAEEKAREAINWERLRAQVLEPLIQGEPASWHPLDFESGIGWRGWKDERVSLDPSEVVLLDGAYSARPELDDILDVRVLVEAAEGVRRARIARREGDDFAERWHAIWDEAEDHYFINVRPPSSFDVVVDLS